MPVFGSGAGMIMLADRLVDPASCQETLGAIEMTVRLHRPADGTGLPGTEATRDSGSEREPPYARS